MGIDVKQKVLLAIYTEYQKDLPNMETITAKTLGIDPDKFKVAVDKLQCEGFIDGVHIIIGGNTNVPRMVILDDVKMTRYGIEYVEQKLQIENTLTGEEKVKNVAEKAAEWGWNQFKDFAAKVLAEMLK